MNDRNNKSKLAIYIDISRQVFEHRTVCTTIKITIPFRVLLFFICIQERKGGFEPERAGAVQTATLCGR
jgi:hypothetical protein